MSDPRTVSHDKASTLDELNTLVSQQEDLLGPLVGIGNDGNKTLLTFDMDEDPPSNHAAIAPKVGGESVVPAGSTEVCDGEVFIGGQLTDAIATRPD